MHKNDLASTSFLTVGFSSFEQNKEFRNILNKVHYSRGKVQFFSLAA